MRIYLESTKSIYFCICLGCNHFDRDGMNDVYFKLIDGLTLIVKVPVGEYERVIRPRLLKNGYYSISTYYSHQFVKQV